MKSSHMIGLGTLGIGVVTLLAACQPNGTTNVREYGPELTMGNGTIRTYAEFSPDHAPLAIGVAYSSGALAGLPTAMSDGHHCFDRDSDGAIDPHTECLATHETVMPLPDAATTNANVPFKWVLFNWNPVGHVPPGVYDVPHFDVHFYIDSIENVFAIQDGPCGSEFIRCDQLEIARKPLPASYMPPDYQSVDAIVPAMGNHLIDVTGPEFTGEKWTRNFIFGAYDGKVTFYEEMVTQEYLLSKPQVCNAIKTPPAVSLTGYYPTQTCLRYESDSDSYTVSMEDFVLRQATAPM